MWRRKQVDDLLLDWAPTVRLEHAGEYWVLRGKSETTVPSAAEAHDHQFLIGGLIVPLIATVGVNNKVTFLEESAPTRTRRRRMNWTSA